MKSQAQDFQQPEIKENLIVTLNRMGYMLVKPERFMQFFIDFAAKSKAPALDIGAAYGVATLAALEKGAQVVANDMDVRHLEILQSKVPDHLQKQLQIKVGKIPSDLDFSRNYFGTILASRVLNFVDPNLLRSSFALIYKWLKPGGRFIYLGATPFMGTFKDFLPQYMKNKEDGCEWPGLIDNVQKYAPHRSEDLPSFINLIDEALLKSLMKETGFKILEIHHIPAEVTHPEDMKLDGREHLGLIACKA